MCHGTHTLDPRVVAKGDNGVDRRFGATNCWYGRGQYFAFNSSYSDAGYTHKVGDGTFQMLLCKVLVGKTTNDKKHIAPSKVCLIDDYDSWRDNIMVVNYQNNWSYTSYLIHYKHK